MRPGRTETEPGPTTTRDARAHAVLRVLAGDDVSLVAADLAVDPGLLKLWVDQFVAAGSERLAGRAADGAARVDRLLSLIAHELRTPVGVLQGWTEVLETELGVAASAPRTREALRRVRRSGDRLRRLIDDLLDAVAASLGRYDADHVALDLARLSRDVVGDDPAATLDTVAVAVRADPAAVRRIATRLVAAVRLGASSAPVLIRTRSVGIWGELAVTRVGSQLSLETIHDLLDPLDVEDDRYVPSLGVHLARAIAVAHGGYVAARAEDEGTTLYLRLPRAEP